MYVCARAHAHMCVCMCAYMCVRTRVCMYMHVCMCVRNLDPKPLTLHELGSCRVSIRSHRLVRVTYMIQICRIR